MAGYLARIFSEPPTTGKKLTAEKSVFRGKFFCKIREFCEFLTRARRVDLVRAAVDLVAAVSVVPVVQDPVELGRPGEPSLLWRAAVEIRAGRLPVAARVRVQEVVRVVDCRDQRGREKPGQIESFQRNRLGDVGDPDGGQVELGGEQLDEQLAPRGDVLGYRQKKLCVLQKFCNTKRTLALGQSEITGEPFASRY